MNLSNAIGYARTARSEGRVVGYAAGVFDLFHAGHKRYLSECGKRCDCLIVGVDIDDLVRRNKGPDRPVEPFDQRLSSVLAHESVALAFAKTTSLDDFVGDLRPDRYFIPDNRRLTANRVDALQRAEVELIVIPYLLGVSTTDLLRARATGETSDPPPATEPGRDVDSAAKPSREKRRDERPGG